MSAQHHCTDETFFSPSFSSEARLPRLNKQPGMQERPQNKHPTILQLLLTWFKKKQHEVHRRRRLFEINIKKNIVQTPEKSWDIQDSQEI